MSTKPETWVIFAKISVSGLATLNEVLTGTERVLDTPLPIAYTIAISQIAWIYVLVLPFQLYTTLQWVTIPGSISEWYLNVIQYQANECSRCIYYPRS